MEFGRDPGVQRQEEEPEQQRPRDGDDVPFGPRVGDEAGFAEDGDEGAGVDGRAPYPVTGRLAVGLDQVVPEEEHGDEEDDEGMVEAVGDPRDKRVHLEEDTPLRELVQLGVSVEEACGNELIEYAQDERRHHRKDDVVEGEGP